MNEIAEKREERKESSWASRRRKETKSQSKYPQPSLPPSQPASLSPSQPPSQPPSPLASQPPLIQSLRKRKRIGVLKRAHASVGESSARKKGVWKYAKREQQREREVPRESRELSLCEFRPPSFLPCRDDNCISPSFSVCVRSCALLSLAAAAAAPTHYYEVSYDTAAAAAAPLLPTALVVESQPDRV